MILPTPSRSNSLSLSSSLLPQTQRPQISPPTLLRYHRCSVAFTPAFTTAIRRRKSTGGVSPLRYLPHPTEIPKIRSPSSPPTPYSDSPKSAVVSRPPPHRTTPASSPHLIHHRRGCLLGGIADAATGKVAVQPLLRRCCHTGGKSAAPSSSVRPCSRFMLLRCSLLAGDLPSTLSRRCPFAVRTAPTTLEPPRTAPDQLRNNPDSPRKISFFYKVMFFRFQF